MIEAYLKYSKAVLTAMWCFAVVEQYGYRPKLGVRQLAYFIKLLFYLRKFLDVFSFLRQWVVF